MNYRTYFFTLLIFQTLFFLPVFFKGYVIFPHANDIELGAPVKEDHYPSNRKFSDQSSVYIPELYQQIHGKYQQWLSTWNPEVQFGRPTFQVSGISKAYILTHLLSLFIQNPFQLYTYLVLITVLFTGIFMFLLLKSWQLHPLACLTGTVGLSLGVFFSYWLTFLLFLSVICWVCCLLWCITCFIQKSSFLKAFGIVFATHNLLMTGYPQFIVLQAYFIFGYTLFILWKQDSNLTQKLMILFKIVSFMSISFFISLPVYLDLWISFMRSSRIYTPDSFFLSMMPKLATIQDALYFLIQLIDAFLIGNPIRRDYPVTINGLTLTPEYSLLPFYLMFFILSFSKGFKKKLWLCQLWFFLCFLLTLWPAFYTFVIHCLGFRLSPLNMLCGTLIPFFGLCSFSIHQAFQEHYVVSTHMSNTFSIKKSSSDKSILRQIHPMRFNTQEFKIQHFLRSHIIQG